MDTSGTVKDVDPQRDAAAAAAAAAAAESVTMEATAINCPREFELDCKLYLRHEHHIRGVRQQERVGDYCVSRKQNLHSQAMETRV